MEKHQGAQHGEVNIIINKKHYVAPKQQMTGREIKELGGIPPANRLFREESGRHDDTPIGDEQVVELKNGDHFYDLPGGVVGEAALLPHVAEQVEELRSEFGDVQVHQLSTGITYVEIMRFPLPEGWSPQETRLLISLQGFPEGWPPKFWTDTNVVAPTGQAPAGAGDEQLETLGTRRGYCFSANGSSWGNERPNLWKYVKFVKSRFSEERR
jgi:hypothetical protein